MNRLQELLNEATTECMGVKQVDHAKLILSVINECIDIVKPTEHHEVWAQSYLGGLDGLELLYDKVNKIKERFDLK
jgi:hypothetical protein